MKKILLLGGALLAVVAGVAAMSAYEAHVINVTAHIENALYVHPDEIAFGTVFPQEYVERDFTVELSSSFIGAPRVDDVEYVIKQKPKCICNSTEYTNPELCPKEKYAAVDYATENCPALYHEMENLCQFLSKVDADPGDNNDTSHPSYYIDPTPAAPNSGDEHCAQPIHVTSAVLQYGPTGWGGWSCPANTTVIDGSLVVSGGDLAKTYAWKPGATTDSVNYPNTPFSYTYTPPEEGFIGQNDNDSGESIILSFDCMPIVADATGKLWKHDTADLSDLWKVDLKVPPVEGFVGQDWPAGCPTVPKNDVDYGCDLWIEVTNISKTATTTG